MPSSATPSETSSKANLLLDSRCMLGEGAIWDYQAQRLYWVDIELGQLHWLSPSSGISEYSFPGKNISTVVPTSKGALLVALKDGIYDYQLSNHQLTLIQANPENHLTGNRFNDGKCDPSGRFWVGTMGDEQSAALYRVDRDYAIYTMQKGITNSNGIVWSADKKTMYYIDTPTYKVTAYTYNNKTGQISNPRVVINVPKEIGYPDGATIDAEGMLWIAIWGGYCVGRWNPETGELLSKVAVDAKNVTSCAFGSEALDTLYITTARTQQNEEDLKKYPHSGGLFALKPGVKGVKANFFEQQ
uniref:SMP-30/gluconolactonase/LRE family protein n=1 Tax=Pedobacter schmidteae TaxID=2201271 RepID=UPI000EB19A36|nr:SMP-30/gluconolactonase/LRE family protein [Pedobacter schmidteae]